MRKIVFILLLLFCTLANAQQIKERRIYYLDCSKSMVGYGSGAKDIWDSVITNLKQAIDDVSPSETTEIIVLKFATDTSKNKKLEGVFRKATIQGKKELIDYIDRIPRPGGCSTITYHIDPIKDFKDRMKNNSATTTYMFLMTDGDDNGNDEEFNTIVRNWEFGKKQVYSFYVMLNENDTNDAEKKKKREKREDIIKNTPKFWSLKTANVNMKIIKPTQISQIKDSADNICIDMNFAGNIGGWNLSIKSDCFDIKNQTAINDNTIRLDLDPKANISGKAKSKFSIDIIEDDVVKKEEDNVYKVCGNDKDKETYLILVEKEIGGDIIVNKGISITKKNNKMFLRDRIFRFDFFDVSTPDSVSLGKVKYYQPSVFYKSDSTFTANCTFDFKYNKLARTYGTKAEFYFNTHDNLPKDKFKVYVNGNLLHNNVLNINEGQTTLEISFWIAPDVADGDYKISLVLLPGSDLTCVNGSVLTNNANEETIVKEWIITHEKVQNPALIFLWWLLSLLLFSLCMRILNIYSHRKKLPRFPQDRKIRFEIGKYVPGHDNLVLCPNETKNYKYKEELVTRSLALLNTEILNPYPIKKIVILPQNEILKDDCSFWNKEGDTIYVGADFKQTGFDKIEIVPQIQFIEVAAYRGNNAQCTIHLNPLDDKNDNQTLDGSYLQISLFLPKE